MADPVAAPAPAFGNSPFRFSAEPTTAERAPAVIALQSAVIALQTDRHETSPAEADETSVEPKTIEEATLAPPSLDELFAALEKQPIRLKTFEQHGQGHDADAAPAAIEPAAPPAPAFAPNALASQLPPVTAAQTEATPASHDAHHQQQQAVYDEWAMPDPRLTETPKPIALKPIVEPTPVIDQIEHKPAPMPASSSAHELIPETELTVAIKTIAVKPPVDFKPAEPAAEVAAPPPPAPKPVQVKPVVEPVAAAIAVRAEKPAARPATPVQPAAAVVAKRSNVRSLVAAAAVVAIVAVIGVPLSRLWLERGVAQPVPQQQAVPHPAPAPKPAPRPTAPAAAAATAPAVTAAHAPEEKPQPAAAAALPQPTAAARVRPTAPAATTRVGGNVSRPSTHAAPPPAALAALAPTVEVPSATALAATTAATEAPAPLPAAAPAPAAGPFYELNDVDRPPQALTKVDVTIPASLQDRSVNEIAVVRVLVAQTGRPVLVSLLRRSKAGLALDEAVIAAVKQWTFTPAVKRGQNVSCFYHVAVTVR